MLAGVEWGDKWMDKPVKVSYVLRRKFCPKIEAAYDVGFAGFSEGGGAMRWVLFSDLDGSLLNHDDYSFAEARPALEKIKRFGIPLILTTSKTRREVEAILAEMDLLEPFIVENGAALFFPARYRGWDLAGGVPFQSYVMFKLGVSYVEIRAFVKRTASRFGVKGFGDWSVEEIVEITGLPPEKVRLAKEREFTEPFLPGDEKEMEELRRLALKEGIAITRGGMFHHFIGAAQDKGKAVKVAQGLFRRNWGDGVRFIGIGDSANDIPMLERVDVPVLVPHLDGSFERVDLPNLIRAFSPGSRGWNEAVWGILNDVERFRD